MTQISRTYSFNDAVPMTPGQVESEIFNIVNSWNNHEKGIALATLFKAAAINMDSDTSTPGVITFTSANGSLTSTIKYTINNFTINSDSTNGLNLNGNGGNIALGATSGSYGGGVTVVFIPNRSAAPTTNPTGGGILYAEAGALVWRGSAGTVTTIAPA